LPSEFYFLSLTVRAGPTSASEPALTYALRENVSLTCMRTVRTIRRGPLHTKKLETNPQTQADAADNHLTSLTAQEMKTSLMFVPEVFSLNLE